MRHLLVLVGSAALVLSTAALPDPAVGHAATDASARPASAAGRHTADDHLGAFDVRRPLAAGRQPAARQKSFGGALFELDPATGTVRVLQKLDGFLTGPSGRPARSVALGYVRQHLTALGLTGADLRTFHFHRDYVDIEGTHHLSWTQEIGGEKVFDAGLQAAVTRSGRLLTVFGSPVSRASAPAVAPRTLAAPSDAITAARRDSGETSELPGPEDSAEPVVFVANGKSHSAWQTITMSAANPTLDVFDAVTGRLLYRRPLAQDDHSRGIAVEYFPGADHGGTQKPVDLTARGWLPAGARKLSGNNSHTYSDVNDDQKANPSEEVPPLRNGAWNYPLTPFHLKGVRFCDNPYPCTWNPDKPFSWKKNVRQNATQVFFFVNNWHDHLLKAPIGFTEEIGRASCRKECRSRWSPYH